MIIITFTDSTDIQYNRYKDIVALSNAWLSNQNGLHFLYLNTSSLRKHFSELLVLLSKSVYDVAILILTKLNIKNEEICLFPIPGYDNYAYSRETSQGGGISVYYKEKLILEPFILPTTAFEAVHIKISIHKRIIHVIALYRPPRKSKKKITQQLDIMIVNIPRHTSYRPTWILVRKVIWN